MGKATMIILSVIYASLESEKNILHFILYTERLSKEHVRYGAAFRVTSRVDKSSGAKVTGSLN